MSSASSTTEDCDWARPTPPIEPLAVVCERLAEEVVEEVESRREPRVGALSDGWSGILLLLSLREGPLKLPSRPMEPTPGVERSGMGGGPPPIGAGRWPAERGPSSVGLPPKLETDEERPWDIDC